MIRAMRIRHVNAKSSLLQIKVPFCACR